MYVADAILVMLVLLFLLVVAAVTKVSARFRVFFREQVGRLMPRHARDGILQAFEDYEEDYGASPLSSYIWLVFSAIGSYLWERAHNHYKYGFFAVVLAATVVMTICSAMFAVRSATAWYAQVWIPAGIFMAITVRWPAYGVLLAIASAWICGVVQPSVWHATWVLPNLVQAVFLVWLYHYLGWRIRDITPLNIARFAFMVLIASMVGGLCGAWAGTIHDLLTGGVCIGTGFEAWAQWTWSDLVGTLLAAPFVFAGYPCGTERDVDQPKRS
ncbi:MAG: hypothetical protein PVJ57_20655 [Phycisphaerae bacterium]|jgi:hypothetical protein